MRALCGAIITAGALIGLGLTSIGFGTRYGQAVNVDKDTNELVPIQHLWHMDRPLVFILIFLTLMALGGLAIAFVGLAYHHHRRHHELHRMTGLGERPHAPV
jgi:formate hydrogenlyase subunit 3/multisubunit Na+/H+ antiporter MnhD subunit